MSSWVSIMLDIIYEKKKKDRKEKKFREKMKKKKRTNRRDKYLLSGFSVYFYFFGRKREKTRCNVFFHPCPT